MYENVISSSSIIHLIEMIALFIIQKLERIIILLVYFLGQVIIMLVLLNFRISSEFILELIKIFIEEMAS